MQRFLQSVLAKPVIALAARLSSRPDRKRVHSALTKLRKDILKNPGKKGPVLSFSSAHRFIIFSDQHKGARNGADNFMKADPNYRAALEHYDEEKFHFISLGDGEELWGNSVSDVRKHNRGAFAAERKFVSRNAFTKVIGNHDLYWGNDPFAGLQLKKVYRQEINVFEGVVLQTTIHGGQFTIFCTHGHQGDRQSDGNWFSKFFVSNIWMPLQQYLSINPNTPSVNDSLKTVHNQMMYEWSSRQHGMLLITGHTHQPVFQSLTQLESLYNKLDVARKQNKAERIQGLEDEIKLHHYAAVNFKKVKPTYFNSGCCCFNDGDITGIEIADGAIRLVRWGRKEKKSVRTVLEEVALGKIAKEIIG